MTDGPLAHFIDFSIRKNNLIKEIIPFALGNPNTKPVFLCRAFCCWYEVALKKVLVAPNQSVETMKIRSLPSIFLLVATLLWAGNFIAGKAVYKSATPVALAFWRWAVAASILLPLDYKKIVAAKEVLSRNYFWILAFSLSGIVIYSVLLYTSLHYTFAINASLLLSITPIFIVTLSWIFYGQKLGLIKTLGLILSFSGALTVISKGSLVALTHIRLNRGDVLMLLAAFSWAVYTLLIQRKNLNVDSRVLFTMSILIGVAFLFPLYLGEIFLGYKTDLSIENITAFIYIMFSAVLGYFFWIRGVQPIGADKAGFFLHLIPVFSSILAVAFLNESVHVFQSIGLLLVLTGIFVTQLKLNL